MFPQKFNNKTNGITQRRFLMHGNPLLADWVSNKIGEDWITNLKHLKKLEIYADDKKAQRGVHADQVPEQAAFGRVHPEAQRRWK